MNKPVLVVMAAGMGSRYGGMKQIDPVGPKGQPIVEYSLYDAHRAGFETVIFVIKHEIEEAFKAAIGDRVSQGMNVKYAFQQLDELPAGKLDPGEDPVTGALRELKEETGAVSARIVDLGKLLVSPGCYGETLHLFLAKGLKFSQQQLDPDEFLNVERVPFDEMVHRCVNGEIDDAKTVAAVLRAKVLLNL